MCKSDFIFGDMNVSMNLLNNSRTIFMRNFCSTNYFDITTEHSITRIGHGNQRNSGLDHILVKSNSSFIQNIGQLITIHYGK